MAKFKVLLVDDEEEFVRALAERLQLRNFYAYVALNGEEALQTIEQEIPDVMVLDLRMPGIDGMEVLRRVKKTHPEIQVIILSGHGSKKDEEEAKQLGAFEFLQKPMKIEHLVKVLEEAYSVRIAHSAIH